MKIIQLSTLNKILKDDPLDYKEFNSFSVLKNERFSYQIAFKNDSDKPVTVNVTTLSPVKDTLVRREIYCFVNKVGYNPDNVTAEYVTHEHTFVPDALHDFDGTLTVPAGENAVLLVTLRLDRTAAQAGKYALRTLCQWDGGKEEKVFVLNVIDAYLPKQKIMYTNWFHCDAICHTHKVKVFSEEFWALAEKYMLAAHDVGMNMILTPIITPPLDTVVGSERMTVQLVDITKTENGYEFEFSKLYRWVALAKKCGMKYFEMAHLFSQWGAKCCPKVVVTVDGKEEKPFGWDVAATDESYRDFLQQFLTALVKVIKDLGIEDQTFFHISDEPHGEEAKAQYLRCKAMVSDALKGFRIMDALSDPEYYKEGVITYPVPVTSTTDKFCEFDLEHRWTYYCCGPTENASNRFLAQHGWVTRALGSQLFKYKIEGFLHWGFNSYFTHLSQVVIDPYVKIDMDPHLPTGDSYIVYPYGNKVADSLRGQLFYDALQDQRALDLLAEKLGHEQVVKMLEDIAGKEIKFYDYPHNGEFILAWRKAVNDKIKELC